MKRIACLLVLFMSMPLFGQDGLRPAPSPPQTVVDEAKASRAKKHHEAMVQEAESLLQEKEELEAKLLKVNQKLGKLERGEDVAEELATPSGYTTICGSNLCYVGAK